MKREEALNILKQVISWRHDNLRGHHEMKYVAEAIELIMSPFLSLPSNPDEAAEEIVRDWLAYGDGEYKKLVIAGAEWMAGQGYVDTHAVINEYRDWGDGFANLELAIATNDDFFEDWQEPNEIIIQIRKKQ